MNKHDTWVEDNPTHKAPENLITIDLSDLNKAFDIAENVVGEHYQGRACAIEDKNKIMSCPICYFRMTLRNYLCKEIVK